MQHLLYNGKYKGFGIYQDSETGLFAVKISTKLVSSGLLSASSAQRFCDHMRDDIERAIFFENDHALALEKIGVPYDGSETMHHAIRDIVFHTTESES